MTREGTRVSWAWGDGRGEENVQELYCETVTLRIKGTLVSRHGTQDNPAYRIKQDDGSQVLKLHSELCSES